VILKQAKHSQPWKKKGIDEIENNGSSQEEGIVFGNLGYPHFPPAGPGPPVAFHRAAEQTLWEQSVGNQYNISRLTDQDFVAALASVAMYA
jgi:hypothetical protein